MKLFLGDCLEVLPMVMEGSVDVIITDPPFGIGSPQRITDVRGKQNQLIGKDFGTFDQKNLSPKRWLSQCIRVLKKDGVLLSFYGAKRMHILVREAIRAGFEIVQDFHWCKTNPPCPMRGVGFSWGVESGYIFRKKGEKHKTNKKAGVSPNWISTALSNGDHPTQKRVDVMKWLVSHFSFKGDTILDPFMGYGTTGVAAIQLGRGFIGIEKNKEYFGIAKERLSKVVCTANPFD